MMPYCYRKGYLVSGNHELPSDLPDHDIAYLRKIGCSRLRCPRCGAAVRHERGIAFATKEDLAPEVLATIYDLPDLLQSPLLHRTHDDWRLYLCRCSRWLETHEHELDPPDPDDTPGMEWHCEGHPFIALPHVFAGIRLANEQDVRDLTQRGLHGETPETVREIDREGMSWLLRLQSQLEPSMAGVMTDAAVSIIRQQDLHALPAALKFIFFSANDTIRELVFELITTRRDRLASPTSMPLVPRHKTTEDVAWAVVAPLMNRDGATRTFTRQAALTGQASRAMFEGLTQYDSDWILNHLQKIARAAPGNAGDLVDSLICLPDNKRSANHKKLVQDTLIDKDIPLEGIREEAKAFETIIHKNFPSQGKVAPLKHALPHLPNGTALWLEITAPTTNNNERQLNLHVTRTDGTTATCLLKQDSKVYLMLFLKSKEVAERIMYKALDALGISPDQNLAQQDSPISAQTTGRQDLPTHAVRPKRSVRPKRRSNLGKTDSRLPQVVAATQALATQLTGIPVHGPFEFVFQPVGPIGVFGEVVLRLAPNPLTYDHRFIELRVYTPSGKSWQGRWIGQGTNQELEAFLHDEQTPSIIVRNANDLQRKLIEEDYE